MQRPPRSQSPKRVGSGPAGPPVSRGRTESPCEVRPLAGTDGPAESVPAASGVLCLRPASSMKLVCQNEARISRPRRPKPLNRKAFPVSSATLLTDRLLLRVSGPDSAGFLQGQLTQDVSLASADHTLLAGLADAKGRLLWCGHLLRLQDGALALLVPSDTADTLLAHLRRYVLRSRVELGLPGLTVHGFTGTPDGGTAATLQRIGLAGDPHRQLLVGADQTGPAEADALQDWNLADIRQGLPQVVRATSSQFIPQTLNLDLLGGISFTKGCYTGQEIVARTRYLGRIKRRMLRFEVPGPPPPPGTPVHAGRGASGQVVQAAACGAGSELLAAIYMDDLAGPLSLEGQPGAVLRRLELPYEVPGLAG